MSNILALLIEGDGGVLRQIPRYALPCKVLPRALHQRNGLSRLGMHRHLQGQVFLTDLLHLCPSMAWKILIRQLFLAQIYIIVEAMPVSGAIGNFTWGCRRLMAWAITLSCRVADHMEP